MKGRGSLRIAVLFTVVWLALPAQVPAQSRSRGESPRVTEIEQLIYDLSSQQYETRLAARERLLSKRRSEVLKSLISALESRPQNKQVKTMLAEFGEPAVDPLVRVLTRTKPVVERWKEAAESAISPTGMPVSTGDEFHLQRAAAAVTLVAIGADSVPAVIPILESGDGLTRAYAAKILGMIGDERALEPLVKALDDEVASVVWNAAWSLGELGDVRAFEPLVGAFNRIGELARAPRAAGGAPSDLVANATAVRAIIIDAVSLIKHPGAFAFLSGALEDRNKDIRMSAVKNLVRIRMRPAPDQSDEFRSSPEAARLAEDSRVIGTFVSLLKDADMDVRAAAALALGRIGDERAIPVLTEIVTTGYEDATLPPIPHLDTLFGGTMSTARSDAVKYLGKFGGVEVFDTLMAALKDSSDTVQATAVRELAKLGDPRSVEPMLSIVSGSGFGHDTGFAVRAAVEGLGQLGDARAVPPLVKALEAEDQRIAIDAARSLGSIGDAAAVPALIKALKSKSEYVRAEAAEALGKIGDASAAPALIAALRDPNKNAARGAATGLRELKAPEAVSVLIEALDDEDTKIRAVAAEALGATRGPAVIAPLTECLSDPELRVRKAGIWGLRAVESDESSAILIGLLTTDDDDMRKSAAAALREIKSPSLTEPLAEVYRDGDVPARVGVAKVLGKVEGVDAVELLAKAIKDESTDVRRRAAWSLEDKHGPRVAEILLAAFPDEDSTVTEAVAWSLFQQEDPRSFNTLLEMMHSDLWTVRQAGIWGIALLDDPRGMPQVVRMLQDPVKNVRWFAAVALAAMGDPATLEPVLDGYEALETTERAARAFAVASMDSAEARSALRRILEGIDIGDVRANYGDYINRSIPEDLVPLLVVLAKWGDKEMAKDFYWSAHNTMMLASRFWGRMHDCHKEIEESEDTRQRPKWRAPSESLVARLMKELKEGNPKERAWAAQRLGYRFAEYAPRSGSPMFDEGNVIIIRHFGGVTDPPTAEDGWEEDADLFDPFSMGFDDPFMRKAAREEYSEDQMREAIAAVTEALEDPEIKVRINAARALGSTCDPIAVEPLSKALEDKEDEVRRWAAISLGRIRTDAAAEVGPRFPSGEYARTRRRRFSPRRLKTAQRRFGGPPPGRWATRGACKSRPRSSAHWKTAMRACALQR
jgi:HEAT repeat protein